MEFEVLCKNELVARVKKMTDGSYDIHCFSGNPAVCPFMGEDKSSQRVWEFLKSRCFDENRADRTELLKDLGLSGYDVMGILKKTHGRMWEDFIWLKFPGENLCWEDVSRDRQ